MRQVLLETKTSLDGIVLSFKCRARIRDTMEGASGDEKRPYMDETKRLHEAHMKSVVYLMCNSILTPITRIVVSLLV